jgi:hypothetical protein
VTSCSSAQKRTEQSLPVADCQKQEQLLTACDSALHACDNLQKQKSETIAAQEKVIQDQQKQLEEREGKSNLYWLWFGLGVILSGLTVFLVK